MADLFYILKGNNIYETVTPGFQAPVITSTDAIVSANGNGSFTYTITAINSPASFSVTELPYELSLNSSTGVITGTTFPNSTGKFRLNLHASNDAGVGSKVVTLVVTP